MNYKSKCVSWSDLPGFCRFVLEAWQSGMVTSQDSVWEWEERPGRADRTMANKWLHTAHLYYTKCLPSFMWQMLPTNIQDSADSIWTNIKGPVSIEDEAHILLLRSSLSKSQGGSRDRFVVAWAWPEVRLQQARSLAIYRILGPQTPVYSGAVL